MKIGEFIFSAICVFVIMAITYSCIMCYYLEKKCQDLETEIVKVQAEVYQCRLESKTNLDLLVNHRWE